jgi:hypothetical protein
VEERLEQGEVVFFPSCPFPLPAGADRDLLYQQRLGKIHKNISFNPHSGRLSGYDYHSHAQTQQLARILQQFGETATRWLKQHLPQYAAALYRDRVSFRPEEEATRRLRRNARNDLLHVDAFPSRPTNGARILRLFVNIHPSDPRVWVTSETFAPLYERYGQEVGTNHHEAHWPWQWGQRLLGLVHSRRTPRNSYDQYMLRFHQFLKANEDFQEQCRKRFWSFPPSSAWLVFTDTVSHAVLRGRFALEHSFFVPLASLRYPELSPAHILEGRTRPTTHRRAA